MHTLSQFNPWLLSILIIWSIIWKGIALWHSARNGQTTWYVAMIIINTAGILEIVYLLFFRRKPDTGIYNKGYR
jgi:methionyl-tRNA synthetase